MHQKIALGIGKVKLLSHIGKNNDGKLKPLALMNCHDADDILTRAKRTRCRKICLTLLQVFDIAQKTKESTIICCLIVFCTFSEHAKICLSQDTAAKTADVFIIAGIAIKLPDDFRYTVRCSVAAPLGKPCKKARRAMHQFLHTFILPLIMHDQCIVKRIFRRENAQTR